MHKICFLDIFVAFAKVSSVILFWNIYKRKIVFQKKGSLGGDVTSQSGAIDKTKITKQKRTTGRRVKEKK